VLWCGHRVGQHVRWWVGGFVMVVAAILTMTAGLTARTISTALVKTKRWRLCAVLEGGWPQRGVGCVHVGCMAIACTAMLVDNRSESDTHLSEGG
jgi:membrane protein implicated in regulation of membrane protease activity